MRLYSKLASLFVILVISAFYTNPLHPTEPKMGETLFSKIFPDKKSADLSSVLPLKNGHMLTVGKKGLFDRSSKLLWLDPKGEIIHDKLLKLVGDNELTSIATAPNGDIVAVGFSQSGSYKHNWDVFVLCLNDRGSILWQKTFGGLGKDKAEAVKIAQNGDIFVAGWTQSKGAGGDDGYVLRLNKSGKLLWDKTFGTPSTEILKDIVLTDDGGLVVTGYTSSLGAGFLSGLKLGLHEKSDYKHAKSNEVENGWVLRLDQNGDQIWERVLGGLAYDTLDKIVNYNNDFIVAGYTKSNGYLSGNAWLIRLDAAGKTIWERSLGKKNETDNSAGIIHLKNGNILLGGRTSDPSRENDIWLKLLKPNGTIIADFKHRVLPYSYPNDLTQLPNGNIVFVGKAHNPQTKRMNPWVLTLSMPGGL